MIPSEQGGQIAEQACAAGLTGSGRGGPHIALICIHARTILPSAIS